MVAACPLAKEDCSACRASGLIVVRSTCEAVNPAKSGKRADIELGSNIMTNEGSADIERQLCFLSESNHDSISISAFERLQNEVCKGRKSITRGGCHAPASHLKVTKKL